ncbi:UNVERIFIED_CONTAM: hypothetical protein ABIE34_001682 [Jeotgalibacillus campisalis]
MQNQPNHVNKFAARFMARNAVPASFMTCHYGAFSVRPIRSAHGGCHQRRSSRCENHTGVKATKAEKTFLRHMAIDGEHGSSTAELAERAGKMQSSMTMTRSALINKGVIYAPSVGRVAFTLPGMAEYIALLNQE